MGRIRAQAIEESGLACVTHVFDPTPEALSHNAEHAPSAESMFKSKDVDAVFICTPNYLNEPLTIMALGEGKHVFCEKPPAFTAQGVQNVRMAEQRSGRKLMYGFNHRHHESIQRMKSIVDSKELGRILWMRGRYGKEVDESYFEGWRAKVELAGGGIMLDQGIHLLDLLLYLGGGFDEVQAMVSNLYWKADGIEDNAFVNLRSSTSGICASLHSTMTQWRYLFSLEVFLEGGALVLNGLRTSSGVYGDEDLAIKRNRLRQTSGTFDSEERIIYHTDVSWRSEIDHFLEAISNDSPITLGTSTDALNVMQVMDRIYNRA